MFVVHGFEQREQSIFLIFWHGEPVWKPAPSVELKIGLALIEMTAAYKWTTGNHNDDLFNQYDGQYRGKVYH
jgi:hypothetical protein